MTERSLNASEKQPVTGEQVTSRLKGYVGEITDSFLKQAQKNGYPETDVQAAVERMRDKAAILSGGLIPAEDHSFLNSVIENWLGMATMVRDSNDVDASLRIMRQTIDAVQVAMVTNGMLSDEASTELKEKWPVEEKTS